MARIRNTLLSSGMIALIKEELESIRERLAFMLEGSAGLPPIFRALLRETIIDRSICASLFVRSLGTA